MSSTLMQLLQRDMRKILNFRALLIWGAISALGVFFFFTTSGKTNLIQNDEVEFMALFLPQIIFGAWAILSIYFDLVSSDRQHNVLDCILTAGVSKKIVFCGKIISLAIASLLLAFIYLLPISAVIVVLSGNPAHCAAIIKYFLPLWGYIMVYATLGIAISVAAHSTKTALIISLASGLVLMPRFFILIIDGIGAIFKWTQSMKDTISMIAPGVMMETLAHYAGTTEYIQASVIFISSIIALSAVAFFIFCKQDELNYGE